MALLQPHSAAARGFTDAEVARLRGHPAFAQALRHACLSGIRYYNGNRLINLLLGDRGRSAMSLLTLYLHQERRPDDPRSGLTLARLKALCADQDIGSPGRIEAFTILMRVLGFLRQDRDAQDRRVRRLTPTDRLYAAHRERWLGMMEAMAFVMPEAQTCRKALADAAFERAFIRRAGEHFLGGFRPMSDPVARELFGNRNAGLTIAFSLLTAGADDAMPPRQPVTLSLSKLSRQFGVSRVHVRKLLRDAAQAGYIARPEGDNAAIVILPKLADAIGNFFANAFLVTRDCALKAQADVAGATVARSA
ncbi:MAG: hypothetical protein AB7O50_12655 [Pseudolabrys sp.]